MKSNTVEVNSEGKTRIFKDLLNSLMKKQHPVGISQIAIKEIMVVQNLFKSYGEFLMDTMDSTENDDTLINRMVNHIKKIATVGEEEHKKDNFKGQEIEGSRLNNITRISTHEFSFYPSIKRGPLKSEAFNNLISKIREIAIKLSENLHLALGSFPVKGSRNNVTNQVIYVQCGKNPTINNFSKAIPSWIDPEYPGTNSSHFIGGIRGEHFYNKIIISYNEIMIRLKNNTIESNNIIEFKSLCLSKMGYFNPCPALIDILDQLCQYLNRKQSGIKYYNRIVEILLYHDLLDEISLFIKYVKGWSGWYEENAANTLKESKGKLPFTTLSASGHVTEYGGNILCKTAGGETFMTCIDICLDHAYGVSKVRALQDILLSHQAGNIFSTRKVSHMVISNSINVDSNNLLTEDKTITHVDPYCNEVIEVKKDKAKRLISRTSSLQKNIQSSFGGPVHIRICEQPVRVSELPSEILSLVDARNELIATLSACKRIGEQHPMLRGEANKKIDNAIHEFSNSKNIEQAEKQGLKEFYSFEEEPKDTDPRKKIKVLDNATNNNDSISINVNISSQNSFSAVISQLQQSALRPAHGDVVRSSLIPSFQQNKKHTSDTSQFSLKSFSIFSPKNSSNPRQTTSLPEKNPVATLGKRKR